MGFGHVIAILIVVTEHFAIFDASYHGCYLASEFDVDLTSLMNKSDNMTIRFCQQQCKNFTYFSLRNGSQCFCGHNYNTQAPRNGQCNIRCRGGGYIKKCGGLNTNSVYDHYDSNPIYMGCFNDSNIRDLNQRWTAMVGSMSVEVCDQLCIEFPYFGLQSYNCFCGTDYGRQGKEWSSDCDISCDDQIYQSCGSTFKNTVYKHQARQSLSNHNYIGCFKDSEKRDLHQRMTRTSSMTVNECDTFCKEFPYFGVQAGDNCFCGSYYGRHGVALESDCNRTCKGSETKTCGGERRNSIYRHTAITSSSGPRYIGCFIDKIKRDLNERMTLKLNALTIEMCDNFCKEFPYFAVQVYHECRCGTDYGKYGGAYNDECNLRCAGDRYQICGGRWRNSVYQHTAIQSSSEPRYIGCFQDNEDRDLNEKSTMRINILTLEMCANLCEEFPYFGAQDSQDCHCGTDYGIYEVADNSECNMECAGNSSQICGGVWRNSVYQHTPKNYSSVTTYVGCFLDESVRDLNQRWTRLWTSLTVEKCDAICKGFPYFGVQDGNHCFCGNEFNKYGKKTECNVKCHGNDTEICGGQWRNSVYNHTITGYIPKYNYVGCFKDQSDYNYLDLNATVFRENQTLTIRKCGRLCQLYPYFGLQAGDKCFCGTHYGQYGVAPESECDIQCSGNNREICGGLLRNSVYKRRLPKLVPDRNETHNHVFCTLEESILQDCHNDGICHRHAHFDAVTGELTKVENGTMCICPKEPVEYGGPVCQIAIAAVESKRAF